MNNRVIAERPQQQRRKPYGRISLQIGLAIVVAFLAAEIVRQGVADYYVQRDPEFALKWNPDSTDALVALAQKKLLGHDFRGAAIYSRRAIELMPMKASALSTFAMVLTEAGRPKQADRVMTLAGNLGWRDGLTQLWLFQHRLAAGQYAEAFDRADALARRAYEMWPPVFRALAAAAHIPNARGALANKLRQDPPWRRSFFEFLFSDRNSASVDAARALLGQLAHGPTPPTKNEVGAYLQRLTRAGKWPEAAAALRALAHYGPNAGAYVYNGDFDHGPGIQPFDWEMGQSVGFMPSIGEAPDRAGKALRVAYDGFSSPSPIQQVLALKEGRYRLSVDVYEETNSGEDRLTWTLTCPGFAQPVARLSVKSPAQHVWRQEAAEVIVPHNCPSQLLQLIAEPGDRHTSIVAWYDNLRILRRADN